MGKLGNKKEAAILALLTTRSIEEAARTRVAAGALASTMILSRVETAALVACCSRAFDWAEAARRAFR